MPAFALTSAAAVDEKVRELKARIREMQSSGLETRTLATHPMFAGLLPDGMLRSGVAYSVPNSPTLAMAMLAAPSAAGAWCGVVGVPEFGVHAAAALGVDLDRLVLVPEPGDRWIAVTAAIVDVLPLVVVRPPARVREPDAARLAARLRKRESSLIVLGEWPGIEARLVVERSRWEGLEAGYGILRRRLVEVGVEARGRRRSRWIALPGPDPAARMSTDAPEAQPVRPAEQVPTDPRLVSPVIPLPLLLPEQPPGPRHALPSERIG